MSISDFQHTIIAAKRIHNTDIIAIFYFIFKKKNNAVTFIFYFADFVFSTYIIIQYV